MYTPPTISGELGRNDAVLARNNHNRVVPYIDNIDGVTINALIKKYGSPLYVFSEHTIRETAQRAKRAFKNVYPDTTFGWSYKTNYLQGICNIFHQEGWIAEVVSDFEYTKAIRAGIDPKNIIYNGPHKSHSSLVHALYNKTLVQIDNWDELEAIELIIASEKNLRFDVGIRTWMDTKLTPAWSKFGFSFENGEALRAAMRIMANPNLRLHTLHTHIGTYVLEPKAYGVAAENLLVLRNDIKKVTGHLVPCVNLGGGFPSSGKMHGMPDNQKIPPIEEYAKAIATVLNKLPAKERPSLRLETGRHLIDDAGYLITSVVSVKGPDTEQKKPNRSKQSRGRYIVDAGVHLLYTAPWFKINVMPTRPSMVTNTDTVKLLGCLCMNIDVIREEVDLPGMEVNDKLVLHPVGAYSITQSMQFINLRPAVVMINQTNKVDVLRRKEILDDIIRMEYVPNPLVRKKAA
jgi:diaminopimelate decarboxylase